MDKGIVLDVITLEGNISQPQDRCHCPPDCGHLSWGELQDLECIRDGLIIVLFAQNFLTPLVRVMVFGRITGQVELLQLIVASASEELKWIGLS